MKESKRERERGLFRGFVTEEFSGRQKRKCCWCGVVTNGECIKKLIVFLECIALILEAATRIVYVYICKEQEAAQWLLSHI